MLDTVSAQRMSLYGYPLETTPFLEELAGREAVVFDRAAANAIWTIPSHSSMFTSSSRRVPWVWPIDGPKSAGCTLM